MSTAAAATGSAGNTPPPPATAERPDALLRRLEWTVLRRLDGLLQGEHRTLWRGHGLELADLRLYQPGDDPRHIDWNLTARLDEPHVRLFAEERDATAWLLLDLSASMDRAAAGLVLELVALLARVLVRQGCRVGALLYRPQAARAVELLAPGAGRRQVLRLLDRLQRAPAGRAPHATALADLLGAADAVARRRSIVFVLSDFLSAPGWQAPLGRLARRHDLTALRLADGIEPLLPGLGQLRFEDAETGELFTADTDAPGFAARLQALTEARDAELWAALAGAGADTLEFTPADDLLDILLRCVDLRRRRPPGVAARRWHKPAPPAGRAHPPSSGASR
ncbi:DUF58 domain-containing protein [Derxia lacustris]|uniref:DUF58 domain-containing protein n=1 Tax=Derxia lacustris TaxID=764842 RepID=UPI000A176456|nr:DUF58 domain-containing protein [Derxia lacustris]